MTEKHLVIFSIDLGGVMEHNQRKPWIGSLALIDALAEAMPAVTGYGFFGIADEWCHKPLFVLPGEMTPGQVTDFLRDEVKSRYPGGTSRFVQQIHGGANVFNLCKAGFDKADVIHLTDWPEPVRDDALRYIRPDGSVRDNISGYNLTGFEHMTKPKRLFEDYGVRWHVVPIVQYNRRWRFDRTVWKALEHMATITGGLFAFDAERDDDWSHFPGLGRRLAENIQKSKARLFNHR